MPHARANGETVGPSRLPTEDAIIARRPRLFRPDGSWWGLTSGTLLVFAGMAVCYGLTTPEVVTRCDWLGCDRPTGLLVTITGVAHVIFGVRELALAKRHAQTGGEAFVSSE